MNKKGLVGVFVIVGFLLVVGFFWFAGEVDKDEILKSCVKASCCHAKSCVWESEAPDCRKILCTMSCEPETMDCGAGECGVVDGGCEVIWND